MKTAAILTLAMLFVPLVQERPIQNDEDAALRLKRINEEIAMTTEEGKKIIERVKRMLPEVNQQLSTLPLEEAVEKYAKEGNLTVVGWAAFKERSSGLWRILLFYQMDTRGYGTALWLYDPETNKLCAAGRNGCRIKALRRSQR